MRPPGYEPGELPTAPLRDVFAVAKVILFLLSANFLIIFFAILVISRIDLIKRTSAARWLWRLSEQPIYV